MTDVDSPVTIFNLIVSSIASISSVLTSPLHTVGTQLQYRWWCCWIFIVLSRYYLWWNFLFSLRWRSYSHQRTHSLEYRLLLQFGEISVACSWNCWLGTTITFETSLAPIPIAFHVLPSRDMILPSLKEVFAVTIFLAASLSCFFLLSPFLLRWLCSTFSARINAWMPSMKVSFANLSWIVGRVSEYARRTSFLASVSNSWRDSSTFWVLVGICFYLLRIEFAKSLALRLPNCMLYNDHGVWPS